MVTSSKLYEWLKFINSHIKPDLGITNDFIHDITAEICSKIYQGLYPANEIPPKLAKKTDFSIIVNVGRHFVSIIACESYIIYIDPFGIPCLEPFTATFLKKCKRPILYNKKPIQSVKSKYCGLYAVLFVLYYDPPIVKIKMKFDNNWEKNDQRCISYIKKLLIIKK